MSDAAVTHSIAGRMRVRVEGSRAERTRALRALREHLGDRTEVSVSPRTGSALITYDPSEMQVTTILTLLREADHVFDRLQTPAIQHIEGSSSAVGRRLQSGLGAANRSVYVATAGTFDLRVMVPAAFAGLALRQVVSQGLRVRDAPWYLLAYYAFDSYMKLHDPNVRGAVR